MIPWMERWFFTSVRRQLILGVALVHAILMGIFIFDLGYEQRRFITSQTKKQVQGLCETLAVTSVSWVLSDDSVGLQEIIQGLNRYPELHYAMIINTEGRVLAHSDSQWQGKYLTDTVSRSIFSKGVATAQILINTSDFIDMAVPILRDRKMIGWARIGLGQTETAESLSLVLKNGAILMISAVIIGGLIAYFLGTWLTKGLYELLETANEVRMGNTRVRANVRGRDEIGQLALGFNAMLTQLNAHNSNLESTIAERTNTLRASNERFRALFDTVPVSLWEEDWADVIAAMHHFKAQGISDFASYFATHPQMTMAMVDEIRILDVNKFTMNMFGTKNRAELATLFKAWYSSPDQHACFVAALTALAEEKQIYQTEMTLNTVSGHMMCVLISRAFPPAASRSTTVFVSKIDITDKKLMEDELFRSNKELEQFAYIASHDLQAPLRHISSFTQLLSEKAIGADPQTQKWCNYITNAAIYMQALINDLLAYSRIGQKERKFEKISLASIIESVITILRKDLDEKAITISYQPMPELVANKTMITQLIQNLCENAIKFRRPEVKMAITINIEENMDHWLFAVKDNGIGIDQRHFARIFLVFQKLHDKSKYPGTGIGLAICKKIVELHGGEMYVESVEGEGSTFFFSLKKNLQTFKV